MPQPRGGIGPLPFCVRHVRDGLSHTRLAQAFDYWHILMRKSPAEGTYGVADAWHIVTLPMVQTKV